jgi:hypothetical protein
MTTRSIAVRLALAAALGIGPCAMVGGMASAAAQPATATGRAAVVSGGVTEEEREEMLRQGGPYNLRLEFAEQGTGAYLGDVKVTVVDQSGRVVVDVVTDGPWLLAQLPPGTYTVRAAGAPEQRVTVGTRGSTVAVLRFPLQP